MLHPTAPRPWARDPRRLLFAISLVSLFIEVMLIRHLASEIRIFAYFKNLTIIGCYLGLGVGYLWGRRLSPLVTLAAVAALAVASHPATGMSRISEFLNLGDFNMWEVVNRDGLRALLGAGMLAMLFGTIILAMVPLGQVLSDLFAASTHRIRDYSINIAGSLLGVWLFAGLSFTATPPIVWYALAFGTLVAIYRWTRRGYAVLGALGLLSAAAILVRPTPPSTLREIWSPYQKISLHRYQMSPVVGDSAASPITFHQIQTNNTVFLYLLDLSARQRARFPLVYPPQSEGRLYYDLPYAAAANTGDVLILGAGGGNDVAAAVRAGARHVTAVEIDPAIIALGRSHHPEGPYTAPNVTVINEDARQFLRTSTQQFDVIVLGLLDSHTLTSNFSNTNLDSYMYTEESIADMRRRLKPGGLLALSFQVNYPWIGAKMFRMLSGAFGAAPFVISAYYPSLLYGTGGTYFLASDDVAGITTRVGGDPILQSLARASVTSMRTFRDLAVETPTDDWPYLYVEDRGIPTLHLVVSVLLLGMFVLIFRRHVGRPSATDVHFAALGAGFLLLEVALISRFALWWGATWLVSSIVLTLILLAILAANATFLRSKGALSYPALYLALFVCLAIIYRTPLTSNWTVALYVVPFAVIGYLFAKSFDRSGAAAPRALAFNLVGALFGGLSESASYIIGLSGLLGLAIVFYAVSFLALRRSRLA